MMALKIDQNSFETGQFAGMNLDPLSDFEVGQGWLGTSEAIAS